MKCYSFAPSEGFSPSVGRGTRWEGISKMGALKKAAAIKTVLKHWCRNLVNCKIS